MYTLDKRVRGRKPWGQGRHLPEDCFAGIWGYTARTCGAGAGFNPRASACGWSEDHPEHKLLRSQIKLESRPAPRLTVEFMGLDPRNPAHFPQEPQMAAMQLRLENAHPKASCVQRLSSMTPGDRGLVSGS